MLDENSYIAKSHWEREKKKITNKYDNNDNDGDERSKSISKDVVTASSAKFIFYILFFFLFTLFIFFFSWIGKKFIENHIRAFWTDMRNTIKEHVYGQIKISIK